MPHPEQSPPIDPTTREHVIAAIARVARCDPESIGPESRLLDALHGDVTLRLEVILHLEDAFGVSISDRDESQMKTVRDVLDFIGSRPERLLVRPAGRSAEGITLLRPASGDDGALLRPSDGVEEGTQH